jgi:transposase
LSFREAHVSLGVSYRHVFRLYGRYIAAGAKGLPHKGRGKASNRKISPKTEKEVVELYRKRYCDFGPTLFGEKLEELGMKISRETLRTWLVRAGLWSKKRDRKAHRQRRERRKRFGELVQMDGSPHKWFEERGDKCCLMEMVDDATGETLGLFSEEETTRSAMELLRKWIALYGVPEALYTDKKNVFIASRDATLDEQLAGREPETQFSRACGQLGIRIIAANSPQAKGRVERKHWVQQDRLVKEMRLNGICAIKDANDLLDSGFMEKLNKKFGVEPADKTDAHRPAPKTTALDDIFCLEENRKVANDWTVRYKDKLFQILKQPLLPNAKATIAVRETFGGDVCLVFRDKKIKFSEITQRPKPKAKQAVIKPKIKFVPTINHPWRTYREKGRETVQSA